MEFDSFPKALYRHGMMIVRPALLVLAVAFAGLEARAQSFEGLDLSAPTPKKRTPPPPPSKAKPSELMVTVTNPAEGTRLLIDQESVGELPMEPKTVTPGEHVVTLEAPGFATTEKKVQVPKGQKVEISLTLQAEGALVMIEANEGGAMCSIDGAPEVALPLARVLPPGRHEIKGTKQGFKPDVKIIQTQPGVEVTVGIELDVIGSDRPTRATIEPGEHDSDLDSERGHGGATKVVQAQATGSSGSSHWYIWAGVGVVVAGGVAAALVATQPKHAGFDPTTVCNGPCDSIIGAP